MDTITALIEPTAETKADPAVAPVVILVLQRGWVVVGRHHRDGAEHVLTDASVVRRWGTSRGLGEIAAGGPTGRTILDRAGTVRAHELATVLVMDCDATQWADRL